MNSIGRVTNGIIALGKQYDWFINLVLLDYSDYVFHDSVNTITIKSNGIKMFMEDSGDFNDEELIEFLLEMIHNNIQDANQYNVYIDLNSSFLDFKVQY